MAERKDLVITRDSMPANSHVSKHEEKREKKKVEKVVTHKVAKRKKTLGKRMSETFLEEDGQSVMQYIIYDILIQAAKDTFSDLVRSGIDMLLYGEGGSRNRSTYRDRGRSYSQSRVSYNRMYGNDDRRLNPPRERNRRGRASYNFDDIILESREDAKQVLDELCELIDQFNWASVEDFYDLVGLDADYVDVRWGWTDLRNAYIERVRGGGWVIHLPRPVADR